VGTVPGVAGAFVGRFISGIMSAVPSIIVEGSIEDMFNMKRRIWMVFLWACATTAGLVIGPIYGSYVSATFGW
jgi:MFS family permease